MTQTLPSLTTEAAALSVAGAGLRQYQMGSALIGAGADATVVILEPGDNSEVSGVQDSTEVLLRGDAVPALHSRFDFREALPLHLFAAGPASCRSAEQPYGCINAPVCGGVKRTRSRAESPVLSTYVGKLTEKASDLRIFSC
ncbi:hypothetical protein GCM10010256_77280 [Streptomyces coeruleorubidus]|uniref:Uncharacterized protein n=1 Tax=Streptomyces coeruleorubidus TaxID=116188 RepID=A0A5J6ID87_STRC4|nr:hypothetical protein CP976_42245 [Streptomyces coeruleorubidus]GGU05892.1 hypothetical protein GCM10010256_77280 [Streptomyces coeruleorubidus]